ncbi:MAG TPA: cysteine-rich CWC family protein [Pyrinomonadaceae bacterium]|nr:cysteine-rich CWC family protein [Pyrinomonadaceae bacterium]
MSLRKSTRNSLPQFRKPSTCEACGEVFTCGATLQACWCAEINLSETTRAELRSRYQDCLCRACLENFAKGEKNNGEKEEQVSTGTAY